MKYSLELPACSGDFEERAIRVLALTKMLLDVGMPQEMICLEVHKYAMALVEKLPLSERMEYAAHLLVRAKALAQEESEKE